MTEKYITTLVFQSQQGVRAATFFGEAVSAEEALGRGILAKRNPNESIISFEVRKAPTEDEYVAKV